MQIKDETDRIKIGALSHFLIFAFTFFYSATYISKYFTLIYGDVPLFTLFSFELYRLFTGIFVVNSAFELGLNLFTTLTILNYYENKEGTTKFLIKFIVNTIFIQSITLIVYTGLYFVFPIVISYSIKPIPAVGIAFVVKHMLTTEDKNILLYKDSNINDRWLLVLILIWFICTSLDQFRLELIISLYHGYLMCKLSNYLSYSMSDEAVISFEKSESYRYLFNGTGWILIEDSFTRRREVTKSTVDAEVMDLSDDGINQNKEDTKLDLDIMM